MSRRIRSFAVAATAVLAAALGSVPAATAAPAAPGDSGVYNCAPGHFCLYSDWNGAGTRCQWPDGSKANTADDCSFIQRGQKPKSLWNGTGHRMQYYTQTNYHERVGSTPAGKGGNLMGTYHIRSFKAQ
ncbi:peptidase inhibitor family I36 protein [Streptomyces sp. NPDC049577]|uniref:peptidase inhibitor family I36 protein n=1 Tax=Streptomyces sp. NPDC049577 TaxID=3155153 RepID=UPI0034474EE8